MDIQVKRFYDNNYSEVLTTGSLGYVQRRIHRLLDDLWISRISKPISDVRILEVGAGELEHLREFKYDIKSYLSTDIRVPKGNNELLSKNGKFDFKLMDAENIDFEESFDVVIASCLLIHLKNPLKALEAWKKALKPGGILVIYVPTDPGILIRALRKMFVSPKHKKSGNYEYELVLAKEHVSSLWVLNQYIKKVFVKEDVKIRRWPFRFFPSWNLNLAYIYVIKL